MKGIKEGKKERKERKLRHCLQEKAEGGRKEKENISKETSKEKNNVKYSFLWKV